MTIEKAIEANTAAIEDNTAMLKRIADNQEKVLGKGGDAEETGGRASRGRRDEPEEKESGRGRGRGRASEDDGEQTESRGRGRGRDRDDSNAGEETERGGRRGRSADDAKPKDDKPAGRAKKDKGPTSTEVRTALSDLMDVSSFPKKEQQGEADAITDWIEDMFAHLDVKKASEIDAKDFVAVLEWIADVKKNGVSKKYKFD